MMYGKRVFKVLTALFMLSVLVGCGGGSGDEGSGGGGNGGNGAITSLSLSMIETDFPPFVWSDVVQVEYAVTKEFSKESDVQAVMDRFRDRYQSNPSYIYLPPAPSYVYNVENPIGSLPKVREITLTVMAHNGHYECALSVFADPSVALDENLFEALFGPTDAPIRAISFQKNFGSSNVMPYLKVYGDLLSKSPYNLDGTIFSLMYQKEDYKTNVSHSWAGNDLFALWNVGTILE